MRAGSWAVSEGDDPDATIEFARGDNAAVRASHRRASLPALDRPQPEVAVEEGAQLLEHPQLPLAMRAIG